MYSLHRDRIVVNTLRCDVQFTYNKIATLKVESSTVFFYILNQQPRSIMAGLNVK